ncbi:DUF7344 domain-containing protein [Natronorubrum sp. FCH18a]|uniref:DUF7344 domain-containing protein n=1 Tax=Natronorubrum sp. FCH18a TaxID=3447018 RepID=UPI003F517D06
MATSNRPVHASYAPSSATAVEVSTCLSDDDVFHLLQTFRRRETIRYLLHENGSVRMRDIAEHVAAEEHGTTVADLTSTQRQRVYIPLYQSHLPKLDEAGVIEYDKARGLVRPTDDLQLFRPSLEAPTIPLRKRISKERTVRGTAISRITLRRSPRASVSCSYSQWGNCRFPG